MVTSHTASIGWSSSVRGGLDRMLQSGCRRGRHGNRLNSIVSRNSSIRAPAKGSLDQPAVLARPI